MKVAKILSMFALFLYISGCLAAMNDVSNTENITIDIKKTSNQDISITMTNTGGLPVYFYNSLFSGDPRKIPYFLGFRQCSNDLERCNEKDWNSPYFLSSTLITPPVALSKIEAGETIVKSINIVNLIDRFAPAYFFVGKPSKKDIEENYKVQLYVEIYFDEHLKIVEKYQSEWLPISGDTIPF